MFVAVALTFKNTGTAEVSQDIYNDTTLYDSTGQGYDGNFEATASGPSFPVGIISERARWNHKRVDHVRSTSIINRVHSHLYAYRRSGQSDGCDMEVELIDRQLYVKWSPCANGPAAGRCGHR